MPSGYTAPVQDGEITEFVDYALTCARGFGALVMLHDSDQSLEATKRFVAEGGYLESTDYYEKRLEASHRRLHELNTMTADEALAQARSQQQETMARNAEIEQERLRTRARYEHMLAQVEAWEAPGPDYTEFKAFMIKQLRDSIEFDCRPFAMGVPEASPTWLLDQIQAEKATIERYETTIADVRDRNETRRAWITGLLESLETA